MLDSLRIALVCDWLTDYAGAERVLLKMHELFPKAPIYTTLFDPKRCHVFANADVRTSGLQYFPGAKRFHRVMFPLMPRAFERMDLSDYDLVLSSSHAAAKGIITRPETLHVSYCHSPLRYVWDHSHDYQRQHRRFAPFKTLYRPILHRVRQWDRVAAERVDHYIANSHYIAKRIKKYYGREAEVIHPPVQLNDFELHQEKGESYLAVGRLIPYKRFDLVVEACKRLKRPLKVIGTGSELARLRKMAGPETELLGHVDFETLKAAFAHSKAMIFPQMEDFGIASIEAMASGTPILAYEAGGALETVKQGVSGLFFKEQSVDSVMQAILDFEKQNWEAERVSASVQDFGEQRFKSELRHALVKAYEKHQLNFA